MTFATGVIKIDTVALSGVGTRVTQLTSSTSRSVNQHLAGAPNVQNEYDAFVNRWDQRRGELFSALRDIASMAQTICRSFDDVDTNLASELGKSAAPSAHTAK